MEDERPVNAKVRAKFMCHSLTKRTTWTEGEYYYSYIFTPVTGGSPENERFFAATPSGEVRLDALSADLFVVGSEYFLDFTPAA